MKRIFAVCGGSLLAVLLLTVAVCAEEVKTKYFTLDLPSGWKVEILQDNADATLLVAANSSRTDVLNITVAPLPEPMSAKEVCAMTCDSLRAAGITLGEPVASGESYVVEFSQGVARGLQYFTVKDKLASAVCITREGGKEILQKHFKPVDPELFPASY